MQEGGAVRKGITYGCIALIAVLVVSQGAPIRAVVGHVFEDLALALDPSAERAYRYATKYFDATRPDDYDMARARELFETAHKLDPQLQYLQHQRARVAFLEGDFSRALSFVDAEIAANPSSLSSYYVRGLIKGFTRDYAGAAADYETYLRSDSTNWAAINDYAWVLLKADRPLDALVALDWGLLSWPENPWLLNSKATAHFELGQLSLALEAAEKAERHVGTVTEAAWLQAYPGNDPLVAGEGVVALNDAVRANMHTILDALQKEGDDMR